MPKGSASDSNNPLIIYLSEDKKVFIETSFDFEHYDGTDNTGFSAIFEMDGVRTALNSRQCNFVYSIYILYKHGGKYPADGDGSIHIENTRKHTPGFLKEAQEYSNMKKGFLSTKRNPIDGKNYYHFHFPNTLKFERILNPAYPANLLIADNREAKLKSIKSNMGQGAPVVIWGPDGIGKTALIVQLYKSYFDGPRNDDTQYMFIKYTNDLMRKICYEIRTRNNFDTDVEAYAAFMNYINNNKMIIFIDGIPEKISDKNLGIIKNLMNNPNISLVVTAITSKTGFVCIPIRLTGKVDYLSIATTINKKIETDKALLNRLINEIPEKIDYNLYVFKCIAFATKHKYTGETLVTMNKLSSKKVMESILNYYINTDRLTDTSKMYLALLSALPGLDAISVELFKNSILTDTPKNRDSAIKFLIDSGLLETYERSSNNGRTKTTYCYVHPIMKEVLHGMKDTFPKVNPNDVKDLGTTQGIYMMYLEDNNVVIRSFYNDIGAKDDSEFINICRSIASAEYERTKGGDGLSALDLYKECADKLASKINTIKSRDAFVQAWKTFYYTGYFLTFRRSTLEEGIKYLNYSLALAIYMHYNIDVVESDRSMSLMAKSADHLGFALSNNIKLSSKEISEANALNAFSDPRIIALSKSKYIESIFNYKFGDPLTLNKTAILLRSFDYTPELDLSSLPEKKLKKLREYAWTLDNYGFTLLHSGDEVSLYNANANLDNALQIRKHMASFSNKYESDVAWTLHNKALLNTLCAIRFKGSIGDFTALSNYEEALSIYNELSFVEDCKASILNNMSIYQYLTCDNPDTDAITKQMNEAILLYEATNRDGEKDIVKSNLDLMTNSNRDSIAVENFRLLSGARAIIP